MKVDLVYLAWNRVEFTRATFAAMLANTAWDSVERLVVYEDGSTDGTREHLEAALRDVPVPAELVYLGYGSPSAVMLHHVAHATAPAFVKLDNDIAVPPGWLEALLSVVSDHPEVELLGMEAGMTWLAGRDGREFDGRYSYTDCSHIGGVGLMRVSAFTTRPPLRPRGRFGFTEWQHDHRPVRGWITPDLLVPQLDRVPAEPWLSCSRRYVEAGWQRAWPLMDPTWGEPYWRWLQPEGREFEAAP